MEAVFSKSESPHHHDSLWRRHCQLGSGQTCGAKKVTFNGPKTLPIVHLGVSEPKFARVYFFFLI